MAPRGWTDWRIGRGRMRLSAGALVLTAGPLLVLGSRFAPPGASTASAGLLIVSPERPSLGIIAPGQSAAGVLEVRNPGPRAVTIERIETSCPCLGVVGPLPLRIAAGTRGALTFRFDPREEPDFRGGLAVDVVGRGSVSEIVLRTRIEVTVAASTFHSYRDEQEEAMDPPRPRLGRSARILQATAFAALAAAIVLAAGVLAIRVWAWGRYGTPSAGFSLLRGESLRIDPVAFDLTTTRAGEERILKFRMINLTGEEIAIHGFGGSCGSNGCVDAVERYPVVIAPRGSREFSMRFRGPQAAGMPFRLTAELYTGVGTREVVITGRSRGGLAVDGDSSVDRRTSS